jgi:general stress protein 26
MKKRAFNFLKKQSFVSLGTADLGGIPHVSPKLFLKTDSKNIYLIDHLIGVSYDNIKKNPRVAVSAFNIEKARGYNFYGKAEVLKQGNDFKKLLSQWEQRQTSIAATEVIQSVRHQGSLMSYKFTLLKPVHIYRIFVTKVILSNANGVLKTEKIP